jgi:hypothetical protein
VILPFPAYSCFFPDGPRAETKFLHFIGSHRFDDHFYASLALDAIAELRQFHQELPAQRLAERATG